MVQLKHHMAEEAGMDLSPHADVTLSCNRLSLVQHAKNIFPAVAVVDQYTRANFISDLLAGLTVGVLLLPQAMAYAQLALLPPIYGLYTSVAPTIIYALIGGSHTMNLGTIALCGLLTSEIIEEHVEDPAETPENAINIALSVAFITGCFLSLIGLLRFGETVQSYLSPALIGGFHTGAACHIMVSQLRYVLGTEKATGIYGPGHLPRKVIFTLSNIGNANGVTIAIALGSFAIILLCQKLTKGNIRLRSPLRSDRLPGEAYLVEFKGDRTASPLGLPIPGELLAVIIFEALAYGYQLDKTHNIAILGTMDAEMPPFRNLDWDVAWMLLQENYPELITIAMITFSLTLSDAKLHSEEADRSLNPDREILTLSVTNLISPFFGAYVAGAGISRSAVAVQTDQKGNLTQLYSIISAFVVLAAIPFLAYLRTLPQAVLGAVVLMALKGMVTKQFKHLKNFWKLGRNSDFVIWCVTFSVTVFVDLDWGLMIGVIATVNTIFQILARGKLNELGRAPGTNEYIDVEKGGVEYPQVKVVKLESALFFGSKDRFYERVGEYFRSPTPSTATYMGVDTRKRPNGDGDIAPSYHTLVIDASAIIFIDVAGVQKVLTLARGLRKNNSARVLIARASDSVVEMLTGGGLADVNAGGLNGSETFFETVSEAVLAGAAAGLFFANPSDQIERCNSLRCFTGQGGTDSVDSANETAPLLGGGRGRAWDAETAL